MKQPIVQEMIDDILAVIDKYRETHSISYCEAIGSLEIISRDIYKELTEDEEDIM